MTQISDFYLALTQANQRYKLITKKQNQEEDMKDEILMFQFKLSNRESAKFFKSFTFLNLPLSAMHDPNLLVLQDVLIRLNQEHEDFLPLNKSILTKILAQQLLKSNLLYLVHFTKRSMLTHLRSESSAGLFLLLDKVFSGSPRLKRKKLTPSQALKQLQQRFPAELKEIFGVIEAFRDGKHCYETFVTQQAQDALLVSQQGAKTQSFTLFHQILRFLGLKEE